MTERRSLRRLAPFGLIAVVLALVISGCSEAGQQTAATVTAQLTVSHTAVVPDSANMPSEGGGIVVAPPPGDLGDAADAATTAPDAASPAAKPTSPPKTTSKTASKPHAKPTPKPKPQAKPKPKPATVFTSPGPHATNVDLLHTITVKAKGGTLLWVKVINPSGKVVGGGTVNNTTWSWMPELGYARTYIVRTASKSTAGVIKTTESMFTTLQAKELVDVTMFPGNGQTVGVGQPIVITFSAPIAASSRRFVEKQIGITRTKGQPGGFRWFSATELHWRPVGFWQAGSKVAVSLKVYGKRLSPGMYGEADSKVTFTVGRRQISYVDAATHQLEFWRDFKPVRSIPVSLGNDKYPTQNGVHIVSEKFKTYVMDSSTWGLVGAGAYRTKVKWATRISNSGEFVHGAPWSIYAQGKENVSHGCVNMSDANAMWFLRTSLPGDPVIVKHSKGPTLKVYDGYGDWNLNFDKY